jgi:hypothetical protein
MNSKNVAERDRGTKSADVYHMSCASSKSLHLHIVHPTCVTTLGTTLDRRQCSSGGNVRFWPKADMPKHAINVAFGGKADMTIALRNVCF